MLLRRRWWGRLEGLQLRQVMLMAMMAAAVVITPFCGRGMGQGGEECGRRVQQQWGELLVQVLLCGWQWQMRDAAHRLWLCAQVRRLYTHDHQLSHSSCTSQPVGQASSRRHVHSVQRVSWL
jgi:hypothetical protein